MNQSFPKAEIIRLLRKRGRHEAARRLYRIKCKPVIIRVNTLGKLSDSRAIALYLEAAFDWTPAPGGFKFWSDLYLHFR